MVAWLKKNYVTIIILVLLALGAGYFNMRATENRNLGVQAHKVDCANNVDLARRAQENRERVRRNIKILKKAKGPKINYLGLTFDRALIIQTINRDRLSLKAQYETLANYQKFLKC